MIGAMLGATGGEEQLPTAGVQQPRMGKKARRRAQREAEATAAVGSDGQIDAEWASRNPEAAQAKLLDVQREDFNARYRPLEEAAIAEYMKSPEEAAQRAGAAAGSPFGRAMGMSARSLGRRGAQMSGDQRSAVQSSLGLAKARAVGTAENTMRRDVRDRNTEGLGTMISIGKDISGGVNRDMGQAGAMSTQRSQAHKNAKQAHSQNLMGSALGLAAFAFL